MAATSALLAGALLAAGAAGAEPPPEAPALLPSDAGPGAVAGAPSGVCVAGPDLLLAIRLAPLVGPAGVVEEARHAAETGRPCPAGGAGAAAAALTPDG